MPEKGINEVPRALREQYEKGVAATQRNNLDYALSILTAILKQEPAFFPAREALRDAQFRKVPERRGFLKRMVRSAGSSPQLAKAQIELRNHPEQALHTAEQLLNSDPHSVAAHKVVAAAATALDLPKTALFSLQVAFKTSPDKDTALKLSEALAEAGQVERADAVLTDLAKTFPNDPEIGQALKDLSARRTLREGGYAALEGGGGSYRDVLRDKAGTAARGRQDREITSVESALGVIREHEAQLAREPENQRLRRALAELYTQQRQYDRALDLYQQIIEKEGMAEPSIQKAITATMLRRFDDQLAALDPEAPDTAAQRERLVAERQACETDRMRQLVDQYPQDLVLRFELGEVLFRQERITDAIQEFQKAQNNPHKRVAALFYLGQCFARRGIRDLAARTLEAAIREKPVFDDEKKELIYALAGVLEAMDRKAEAMDQLKLIYEVDIGYRDVAARVDAFYTQQSGG
jgi:tetratricopeptide (TPR) repeat protein